MKDRLSHHWVLGLILIAGIALRILAYVGLGPEETLIFAHVADNINAVFQKWNAGQRSFSYLIDAFGDLRSQHGMKMLGMTIPVAITRQFFESSFNATLLAPVIVSSSQIVVMYLLCHYSGHRRQAIVASFLWAIFPISVFMPSQLVLTTTYSTSLFVIGLFSFLVYLGKRTIRWGGLAASAAVGLLLIEPLVAIWLLASIWALYSHSKALGRYFYLSILGLGTLSLVLFGHQYINNSYSFLNHLIKSPEWIIALPLLIVSTVVFAQNRSEKIPLEHYLLVAFGLVAGLPPGEPTNVQASFSPFVVIVFIPVIMLSARYLSGLLSTKSTIWVIGIISPIIVILAWLGWTGHEVFIQDYSGYYWLQPPAFPEIFSIALGIALALLFLSPLLVHFNDGGRIIIISLFLALLSVGFLPMLWERIETYAYKDQAARESMAFLSTTSLRLPVAIDSDENLQRIVHYAEPRTVKQVLNDVSVVDFDELVDLENAYILYPETQLISLPSDWVLIDHYGRLGRPQLALYRTLNEELALEQLSTNSQQMNGADSYQQDYGALINLGEMCQAVNVWMLYSNLRSSETAYIPYNPANACFVDLNESNLITSALLESSIASDYFHVETGRGDDGITELRLDHKYQYYYDPRVFDISLALESSSAYLFSITVKSSSPVWALYWRIGDQEEYYQYGTFSDWTTLSVIFSTPYVEDGDVIASVSPVLFHHYDHVYIKNPVLTRIFP